MFLDNRLLDVVARADVLIESFAPGTLAHLGLAPESIVECYPHLIALSITDFGQTGPYKDWVATDDTMEAIGGMQFKAGVLEKPPLLPPGAIAYDVAGIMGAFAALTAWLQRRRTGRGQFIDLSVLEALAPTTDWSFPNASHVRSKAENSPEFRIGSGAYTIYPCKSGYVRLVIFSPRQWRALRAWLGEPNHLQDRAYESVVGRMGIWEALKAIIGDHLETMTHDEAALEAQRRGIACTQVLRPEEVLANEHFRSRGSFVDAEFAPGQSGPIASGFFELDGERQGYRCRAPMLGEHNDETAAGIWSEPRPAPHVPAAEPSPPFAGLRVLDCGHGAVGVEAGRLFAEYGADVIKIESRTYPDFIRAVLSMEMNAMFSSSNRSKKSFGVNLKRQKGLAIFRELVKRADVIIENSSTGTMEDLGISYDKLRELNPRVVMASSQLLGSHGVCADWIGYGPSTQPIGGLVHLWNYSDQDFPAGSGSIFPDHVAGRLVALAALAALVRRERTGTGGHVEVAQAEVVTGALGDLLLKTGVEPGSVVPMGNRNERGAPWGTYPCAGVQQWCVITVRDDKDWRKLCAALGEPEWAMKPELETAEGRFAAHDAIDEHLSRWTSERTKMDVTASLQMFGVPAAPMYTPTDQISDPHYQIRGFPRWVEQQDLGWVCMEGPTFRASGMSDVRISQAPRLGEHTREICRELLGMKDAEIEEFVAAGTLEVPKE